MTYAQFSASLAATQPPADATLFLQALWYAARGQWQQAHNLAQDHDSDASYNWLHAYLHRQEGDQSNAAYWYRRAGRPVFKGSLAEELAAMVRTYTAG